MSTFGTNQNHGMNRTILPNDYNRFERRKKNFDFVFYVILIFIYSLLPFTFMYKRIPFVSIPTEFNLQIVTDDTRPNSLLRCSFGDLVRLWFLHFREEQRYRNICMLFGRRCSAYCLKHLNVDMRKSTWIQHQWCGRIDLQSWNYKFS